MASTTNGSVAPRLAGKRVAIAETRPQRVLLVQLVEGEGAKVVEDVTASVDLLVTTGNRTRSPLERRALELNKAGKATIEIVEEGDLRKSMIPTREETLLMLRGDAKTRDRWDRRMPDDGCRMDLSGESLRGIDLNGLGSLKSVNLDRADLRDTRLNFVPDRITGANLDGARFFWGALNAVDCSMKGIQIDGPTDIDVSGSDLTGATLTKSHNLGFRYKKSILRDAKLTGWSLCEAELEEADLTGADLKGAEARGARARGATFARANLAKADLSGADLRDADLRGADLRGANLTGTDLTGANVDGATFEDAVLTSTKLANVDTSKAKGFALAENPFVAGPCIKKIDRIAGKARRLESEVRVDVGKSYVTLNVHTFGPRHLYWRWTPEKQTNSKQGGNGYSQTMEGAFEAVCGPWLKGRLRPDTLTVSSQGSPVSGPELKELFLRAWREGLGAEAAEAIDAVKPKPALTGKQRAAALLDELRGPGGVAKWNARSRGERTPAGGFRGADLANAKLRDVNFRELDFQKAKLDGADLGGANLSDCKLAGASFAGASLADAQMSDAVLRGASFRGASLTAVDLTGTDLRKVDFTDAKLTGALLDGAVFDETTILPAGFRAPKAMIWKGKAADPRVAASVARSAAAGKAVDAAAFLKMLSARTDKPRLEKARDMLKADSFKLFVEVTDERLGGVVKSQSDAELVYACTLGADGGYACCTQNLNPCGGLRGAPCKHLLVLVIGLVKGGGIDPGRADGWIRAGRGRAPSLDKDAMTRILLRYKGAEAGEVDWRPMETVPEDYYAM